MRRKRILALILALACLAGCTPAGAPRPTPSPERTPAEKLEWLHGFYAISSFEQLDLAENLDAVSLGWARMSFDAETGPYVCTTGENGNGWVVPAGSGKVLDALKEHGADYPLSVFAAFANKTALPDGSESSVLVTVISEPYRAAAADALAEAAEGYTGLTIDFEGLISSAYRDDFTEFLRLVREKLDDSKSLYVAVPPDEWYAGYDYRALGDICDKVILMAHDYQWQSVPAQALETGDTYTPPAPIHRVRLALEHITDPDTGVADVSKIALAVSFATVGLEVEEDADILKGDRLYNPGVATLTRRLAQPDAEAGLDEFSQSGYVFYHDEEGRRYKVWYESPESVEAKIGLALEYGVTGLSLWRLGVVPTAENYNVWDVILEGAKR